MEKRNKFLSGMLALLLSFGLILAGCDNGNSGGGGGDDGGSRGGELSKLLGTWVDADTGCKWVFEDEGRIGITAAPYASIDAPGSAGVYGIESYDGTTLKFKNYPTFTAKIEGDVLTISGLLNELINFNGTFTKQGANGDNNGGGNGGNGNNDGGDKAPELIGTWVKDNDSGEKLAFIQEADGIMIQFGIGETMVKLSRIITYDGTTVTFERGAFKAAIAGNVLTISGIIGNEYEEKLNGRYIKQ
ncbi:MAG: hypothetical protein LBH51_04030 [Treponema sp.]|jgi:hypothetical protein|nr:hypothetical protein [Treponema sp.]